MKEYLKELKNKKIRVVCTLSGMDCYREYIGILDSYNDEVIKIIAKVSISKKTSVYINTKYISCIELED